MPTKLRFLGPKSDLPDLSNQLSMFFVKRCVIDLILHFQKEIQFLPVQASWEDNSDAGQYFFLFTTALTDAVDRDRTAKIWKPYPPGLSLSGCLDSAPGNTFVFDRSKNGDIHFWVNPHISNGPLVSERAEYNIVL